MSQINALGFHEEPQEGDADFGCADFGWLQSEFEVPCRPCLDSFAPNPHLGLRFSPEYEIVHIADVAAWFQFLANPCVQKGQIEIGKVLAGEVTDWKPTSGVNFVGVEELLEQLDYRRLLEDPLEFCEQNLVRNRIEVLPHVEFQVP